MGEDSGGQGETVGDSQASGLVWESWPRFFLVFAWEEKGTAAGVWWGWQACLRLTIEPVQSWVGHLGTFAGCVHVGTSMAGLGLLWAFVGMWEGRA